MPDRILTSHAGSLPRPEDLVALNFERIEGRFSDEDAYQRKLTQAVEEVVARQCEIGIDLVNDGEYGHSMGHRYDYGSWWTYVFQRLGGLELVQTPASRSRRRGRSPDSSRSRVRPSAGTGRVRRRLRRPQLGLRAADTRRRAHPSAADRSHTSARRRSSATLPTSRRHWPHGTRDRLPELGRLRLAARASATSTTRTTRN